MTTKTDPDGERVIRRYVTLPADVMLRLVQLGDLDLDRGIIEIVRRYQLLLRAYALHTDVDKGPDETARILEQAAFELLSAE
jgi:hypothetical protein